MGHLPICNKEIAYTEDFECEEYWNNKVSFLPGWDSSNSISIFDLANVAGLWLCGYKENEYKISRIENNKPDKVFDLYNGITFADPSEQIKTEQRFKEKDLEQLCRIGVENVFYWDSLKLMSLLYEYYKLNRVSSESSVYKFQSTYSSVPSRNTWGEIALVAGYMICKTFKVENRKWIKILHGKQLLGQAFIERCGNEPYFRGEDIYPKPQVEILRKNKFIDMADKNTYDINYTGMILHAEKLFKRELKIR